MDSWAQSMSLGIPRPESRDRGCKELLQKLSVWLNRDHVSKMGELNFLLRLSTSLLTSTSVAKPLTRYMLNDSIHSTSLREGFARIRFRTGRCVELVFSCTCADCLHRYAHGLGLDLRPLHRSD